MLIFHAHYALTEQMHGYIWYWKPSLLAGRNVNDLWIFAAVDCDDEISVDIAMVLSSHRGSRCVRCVGP